MVEGKETENGSKENYTLLEQVKEKMISFPHTLTFSVNDQRHERVEGPYQTNRKATT